MTRQSPKIGTVIDIEGGLPTALARNGQRLEHCGLSARMGKMRSRCANTFGRRNKARVYVVFAKRHVGAILPIENQWKRIFIANAEEDKRSQPLFVRNDTSSIHALCFELLANETTHMFIADPGDEGRFQAKACGTSGDIGGRAANIF